MRKKGLSWWTIFIALLFVLLVFMFISSFQNQGFNALKPTLDKGRGREVSGSGPAEIENSAQIFIETQYFSKVLT